MDMSLVITIVMVNLIFFGFIALMVKWRTDLKREKIRSDSGSNSLGTSELRGMIQEAMLDAIAPLDERLDLIESRMRQLPQHDQAAKELETDHVD